MDGSGQRGSRGDATGCWEELAAASHSKRKHRRAAENCWNNYLPGDGDGKQARPKREAQPRGCGAGRCSERSETGPAPNARAGCRHTSCSCSQAQDPFCSCGDFEGNEGPRALISGRMVNCTIQDKEGKVCSPCGRLVPDPLPTD